MNILRMYSDLGLFSTVYHRTSFQMLKYTQLEIYFQQTPHT